jgi:hypothetical protein
MTWFAHILFYHIETLLETSILFRKKLLLFFYFEHSEIESVPLKDKEDQDKTPEKTHTLIQCHAFFALFSLYSADFQRCQHYLAAPYFLTICATAAARSSASARVLASAYTRTASSVPEARAKLLPSLYLATTFSISFCAPAGVAS